MQLTRRPVDVSPCPSAALRTLATLAIVLVAPSIRAQNAPILTFSNADAGGASDEYFSISLDNGSGRVVDRLERNPLALRWRTLAENLFRVIGRGTDQAATAGEIFFAPITSGAGSVRAALYVETPIGYAAYFENPGRGGRLGDVVTLTTRPFEAIAASDRNFALLMRRDAAGRTEGAYLYHATTGKALYMDGLRKLEITPGVRRVTSPLPALAGRVAAAPLFAGSERTASYLVVDPASGEIHFLDLSGAVQQISSRKSDLDLYDVFPREGGHASPRRFLAVPVNESLSQTRHVLLLDAVSGQTALLVNVTASGAAAALVAAAPVERWFASDGGERVFSAVPRVTGSGTTIGVWVIDSQTGNTVYVDHPDQGGDMTVSPVTIERR